MTGAAKSMNVSVPSSLQSCARGVEDSSCSIMRFVLAALAVLALKDSRTMVVSSGGAVAAQVPSAQEIGMARKKDTESGFGQALRTVALRYPEVAEGIACKGTALESRTFKAGKKSFLFVGPGDAKLKLRESHAEAAALARDEPSRYKVGANGWVTVRFASGDFPSMDLLERWIDESYRVVADDRLVAMLPDRGLRSQTKKNASR